MSRGKRSERRKAVPASIKRQLYKEAGSKCANPGCPNRLLELHHIEHWHVCKTHNAKDMIAICPTCHEHAHRGEIKIDDQTIRGWKKCKRNPANTGYLYIEPGPQARLLMGNVYWRRSDDNDVIVFRLSDRNSVRMRVIPGNILMVSLSLANQRGEVIVEMRENHLLHIPNSRIKLESRPGRLRIVVPATEEFVSLAMIAAYRNSCSHDLVSAENQVTLLDLHVVGIGTVEVAGIWTQGDRAVIANANMVSVFQPWRGFVHLSGYGQVRGDKDIANLPVFQFNGPLDESVMSAVFKDSKL